MYVDLPPDLLLESWKMNLEVSFTNRDLEGASLSDSFITTDDFFATGNKLLVSGLIPFTSGRRGRQSVANL
jgi:hypothetical protein